MTTSMVLERPGRWRVGSVAVLLALPLMPTLPLLWFCLVGSDRLSYGGAPFKRTLGNSAVVALVVALGSFTLGLPIGVFSSLYDYRGRRFLLALSLLPLLAPSFLWALGWKWLLTAIDSSLLPYFSEYRGCVLSLLPAAVTLVLFTTIATTSALSGSQVESARLAGGEWTLVLQASRYAAVPAALAAVLAAILTASDPGPGRVFGLQVASSEIRISFMAPGESALPGQQSLTLALVVLAAALPIARLAAPHLGAERPARQFRPAQRNLHPEMSQTAAAALCLLVLLLTLFPVFGLILPLRSGVDVMRRTRRPHFDRPEYRAVRGGSRFPRRGIGPDPGVLCRTARTPAPAGDHHLSGNVCPASHALGPRHRACRDADARLGRSGATRPADRVSGVGAAIFSGGGVAGPALVGNDAAVARQRWRYPRRLARPLSLARGASFAAPYYHDGRAAGRVARQRGN